MTICAYNCILREAVCKMYSIDIEVLQSDAVLYSHYLCCNCKNGHSCRNPQSVTRQMNLHDLKLGRR